MRIIFRTLLRSLSPGEGKAGKLLAKADLMAVAFVIAAFVFAAAQGLGTVPLPDTDESMTLQVPYEMINHGKLAFPMYRYLGGNIENVWHSYTPVFFVMLSGFQKVFGWGLTQGRAFNLLVAAILLFIIHLIGRRLFGWQVGLVAVVLLISDPTFLDRSRIIRNDYAAAMFGLLAFYLYDIAESKKRGWLFIATGLAAGAGVMCHTNLLYAVAGVCALMAFRHGWRVIRARPLFQFAAGAAAAMAYEVIYVAIDFKNFLLQNREDQMHFGVLERWGWWRNLLNEPRRYALWHQGLVRGPETPLTLLHLFQYVSVIALIYLVARLVYQARRGKAVDDPRARILVFTVVVMLFLGMVTNRPVIQYIIHLSSWLALCAAVLLSDAASLLRKSLGRLLPKPELVRAAAALTVACVAIPYGQRLVGNYSGYVRKVNNPDRASFEEIKGVLRSVLPEGVCPVAIKSGMFWLAFPEKDYCFATIEKRMKGAVDIEGKDYALLVRPKQFGKARKPPWDITSKAHLIGELKWTAYGNVLLYYTGDDPRYLALEPRRFFFFKHQRGYVTDEQIAAAPEVWSAGPLNLDDRTQSSTTATGPEGHPMLQSGQGAHGPSPIILGSVGLKPGAVYYVSLEVTSEARGWEFVIIDEASGAVVRKEEITGEDSPQMIDELFKAQNVNRVRLAIRPIRPAPGPQPYLSQASVKEVVTQ